MRTIGKFQVVEKIGEGGFGVIYKGLDPHIKRHVAIKSCTSADESVRSRFVQEAQISGNLHHRHIVTVYDFGLEEGVPYLVQEYLNGEDLDRKIKRRDFIPFPEKLLYLMQIARGLQYAHSQGVIHRDIKPANLRILADGTAKIMDFGIAKLTNQETGLTQTGMTLGTAAYLAPEQIRGESVDPRTDIFAYGATAYELLTYRRPFVGQHISTVLYQILNEEPPKVSSIVPDVPPELDHLVMRCLAKDLTKRYADVGELLHDLDHLLKKRRTEITTKSISPPPVTSGPVAESVGDGPTVIAPMSQSQAASTTTPGPVTQAVETTSSTHTQETLTRTGTTALHEIELDGTGESTRTPHGIDASEILRRREFQWGPWAAGVVALAAISLAIWSYMDGPAVPELPPVEAPSEVATAGAGESLPNQTADSIPASEGSVDQTVALDNNPSTEAADSSNEDPVVEEPPPPPNPGKIRIPTAWEPTMTVGIGTQTYPLDQIRELDFPPGVYTLHYRLDLPGYSDSAQRTVTVTSDQTESVTIPILQPGQLDVQPRLSSPQKGYVFLGSELLGPSPIRGRQLKPGEYTLRVRQDLGPDQPAIERPITITAGGRLIVTFNLKTGDLILRDAGNP